MNITPLKRIKIRIIGTIIFLSLALFANFITIRIMKYYGVEVYFYNKLSVAYDIGKMEGLKAELNKILLKDKLPRELKLAREFKDKLNDLEDPEKYIDAVLLERKSKLLLFSKLRTIAIIILILIILSRLIINLYLKRRLSR